MKKKDFLDLVQSIRQAGGIRRKKMRPARVTALVVASLRGIRDPLGESPSNPPKSSQRR